MTECQKRNDIPLNYIEVGLSTGVSVSQFVLSPRSGSHMHHKVIREE